MREKYKKVLVKPNIITFRLKKFRFYLLNDDTGTKRCIICMKLLC